MIRKKSSGTSCRLAGATIVCLAFGLIATQPAVGQPLTQGELKLVRAVEQSRTAVIKKVIHSVIAIYDEDRGGGGSGVIIDPTGIALTNHHVIMGAGVSGWGGLADGKLYPWKLIGTDPGGDVAIIQMEGLDKFPFTPLGDSDLVRVGDWALAMGNPFVLTEDQVPTVTLGIVSGVKRYQPGAGQNQLVYGNCIQVDSSINPGNSGGPLFSMRGEVIGINGRGSFQDRGRVNVGLGYAISSNQIKNFIPDLLATKLVEHGTLDASFADRDGKVICSSLYEDSAVAKAGLQLKDRLVEFEGIPIKTANQYTNLICTLPEDWPAHLVIEKPDGQRLSIHTRLFGLPYQQPDPPKDRPDKDRTPEEQKKSQRQAEMMKLLAAAPGKIRHPKINRRYANYIVERWQQQTGNANRRDRPAKIKLIEIVDRILISGQEVGEQQLILLTDGRYRVHWKTVDKEATYVFDGTRFAEKKPDGFRIMTPTEAKLTLPIVQAHSIMAATQTKPFSEFGRLSLDGGDKVAGQNVYRMKMLDEDEDWFYFWLSMYDDRGRESLQLLKASAEKDCDRNDGGVAFGDWQTTEGMPIPHRRDFVTGLAEKPTASMIAKTVSIKDDVDESIFEIQDDSANQ